MAATDLALSLALPLVAKHEGFREYAYPDPASELARASVGARWGFEPAADVLDRLTPDVQARPGDPWTVGFGETGPHVTPATRMTRAEAERQLAKRLHEFVEAVRKMCTRPVLANRLAAMASLAYNIGLSAFAKSTLLRKFNAGDVDGAAVEFSRWTRAGGQILPGLVARRAAERAMFVG